MRVYTHKKDIVAIKHFRACACHYKLLLELQAQLPNLKLEIECSDVKIKLIPINELNLEDELEIRYLNPNDSCH